MDVKNEVYLSLFKFAEGKKIQSVELEPDERYIRFTLQDGSWFSYAVNPETRPYSTGRPYPASMYSPELLRFSTHNPEVTHAAS